MRHCSSEQKSRGGHETISVESDESATGRGARLGTLVVIVALVLVHLVYYSHSRGSLSGFCSVRDCSGSSLSRQ